MNLRTVNEKLYHGTTVKIKAGFTKDKLATVDFFDTKAKKWKVNFEEQWCGWYEKEELVVIS
jgi:hypothetical protein